ncbi:hypothetical protein BXZ70DRAFT_543302 [Cristinia sonorae]|uniref:Uncharacterized protein n=1 Tax=Cristinia sonorae TaxID=1940300 RepID=A0A8K0UG39_9AGAR|nr:hypothetical protein BXZ70DRAFT_543302 [Cristinia sonorae]
MSPACPVSPAELGGNWQQFHDCEVVAIVIAGVSAGNVQPSLSLRLLFGLSEAPLNLGVWVVFICMIKASVFVGWLSFAGTATERKGGLKPLVTSNLSSIATSPPSPSRVERNSTARSGWFIHCLSFKVWAGAGLHTSERRAGNRDVSFTRHVPLSLSRPQLFLYPQETPSPN